MKKFNAVSICVAMLLSTQILVAQGGSIAVITKEDIEDVPSYDLFQKGSSVLNLLPNIQYNSMTINHESENKTNAFNANLRANYYVVDHVAVVAGIHINNITTIDPFFGEQKTNTFIAELGAQYGQRFGDFPVRFEATVGLGNYTVFENKASTFAYNVNVATYLPLGETDLFVEPFIGYAGYKNNFKENDYVNKTGGVVLGATLVKNIGCGQPVCGFGDKAPVERFAKGKNRLQLVQAGGLGFGSSNREFNGNNVTSDGLFGYVINFADYYYVADNLAVGLGVELDGLTTSDKDSDFKNSSLDFYATPRLRYHVPMSGPLNNLFAEGGLLFGSTSGKTTYANGNTQETKSGTFGYNIGLGYDLAITKDLGAVAYVDYLSKTSTDKETDVKTDEAGLRFMLGLSLNFPICGDDDDDF